MSVKDYVPDGIKLDDAEKARCKAHSQAMKGALDDVQRSQEAALDAEKQTYKIKPMYLDENKERLKCVEFIWRRKKDAPPTMPAYRRTVELNGTQFDTPTGGMMFAETLSAFYNEHEQHRRQYELYTYDLAVLFAISCRGAINFWQVESELASRLKQGVITTVDRNELYQSLERIQRAKLWTMGELPRARQDGQPYFQPREVSLARR